MVKACDSQECPRKATGFCLVIPLERQYSQLCSGYPFRTCWFGVLEMALHKDVLYTLKSFLSALDSLAWCFGYSQCLLMLLLCCNFKLNLSYYVILGTQETQQLRWSRAVQTRIIRVLNSVWKWDKNLWSLEVRTNYVQNDFSSGTACHALEQFQSFLLPIVVSGCISLIKK